jgi:methylthioribulose-1-phosphate dehydratase
MNATAIKEEMAQTIRALNLKGWSPATSTNYSFRDEADQIWVSRSGVDKSNFLPSDFITVNQDGNTTGEFVGVKPSAETLIHCIIYALFPETKVILHSHGVYPIVATAKSNSVIAFEGYEVQKGFAGQTTHDTTIEIPVFENTQNMTEFADTLRQNSARFGCHSFIMRKHGTYAWGTSLFEAKRHLETLDYLCQCEVLMK